jgi:DNA excision repair protein ERCC-5
LKDRPAQQEEEEVPDNIVYVDELQMTQEERRQNRRFRKKDAYHLPELDVSLENMGAPNDPRIMSQEELEEYAQQFHTGEDINLYDFSKIDFNSSFFLSLPASDRYNILNAARLRSRLRMGYSKDQLDTMFPDRMAFSRFQIERVAERNELTQRLMNLNGMNGEDAMAGINGIGRVAGERGKEYVLVKNDGVEGGWALGVVSNKDEGQRNQPIDLDASSQALKPEEDDEEWEDDGGFEDVPIEGLNRLPKRRAVQQQRASHMRGNGLTEVEKKRRALYASRRGEPAEEDPPSKRARMEDSDTLFLSTHSPDMDQSQGEEMDELFEDETRSTMEDETEDLDRAIAMSLADASPDEESGLVEELPEQSTPAEARPFTKGSGRSIAHVANSRSNVAAPMPFRSDLDAEDPVDFQAALVASRRAKHEQEAYQEYSRNPRKDNASSMSTSLSSPSINKVSGFDGPLPFQKLSLGKSLFSKKRNASPEEAGGFEKEPDRPDIHVSKPPSPKPLPPWFSGDIKQDSAAQREIEDKDAHGTSTEELNRLKKEQRILARRETNEVVEVESSDDENDPPHETLQKVFDIDSKVRMGDVADLTRAEPPTSNISNNEDGRQVAKQDEEGARKPSEASDEEMVDWSETDYGDNPQESEDQSSKMKPAGGQVEPRDSKSATPEFEDVVAPPPELVELEHPENTHPPQATPLGLPVEDSYDQQPFDDDDEEDVYSDPEDADLFQQLAAEADEHARFAAELNHRSSVQTAEDYERELKSLRSQQKKDRRDADEVSHIMITECQQLLKLFGLPYITAPMEAEAQCAELVRLGLVDGIVTDDSDTFLFGGTRVYKNMFNQAKFVECYLTQDLEKEFALDRNRLIRIAHLLGSDYTEGLPSVGPVTALEIVSEFDDLEAFKSWWTDVQNSALAPSAAKNEPTPFRRKFRKNAAKLFLPPGFPSAAVDYAYLNPEVDSDPSPFVWGVPDLDELREYLMATIGWTRERTDEVLVPVIRDMNTREREGTQSNITSFFSGSVGIGATSSAAAAAKSGSGDSSFAPRRRAVGKSKRLEGALGKLKAKAMGRDSIEEEGPEQDAAREVEKPNQRKSRVTKGKAKAKKVVEAVSLSDGDSDEDDEYRQDL